MRVPGRQAPVALHTTRPDWMTAGAIRLGILCVFIVLIEMLRPRLSPHSAWIVVIVGAAIMIAGAAVFVGATRRLADRLPFLSGSQRLADAGLLQLRRIGLPLLG